MIEDLIKQSNKEFIENELRPFLQIPSNTLNRTGMDKDRIQFFHELSKKKQLMWQWAAFLFYKKKKIF